MFALELIWAVALFATAVGVTGAAMAPRGIPDPLLRLTTGVTYALGGYFAIGFLVFAAGWPNRIAALLAGSASLVVLRVRWSAIHELGRENSVRRFALAWLLFAGWSIGLLALVVTYSGGGWAVDWVEHWQRALFCVERQPLGAVFGGIYPLTARPPLANVLTALWLEGTSRTFAEYQVFIALFGTLVLLPVWILVRRWSPRDSAPWWALLLLLLSPMVAQNITFTWTKLPTTVFILSGLCWTVGHRPDESPRFTGHAGACLGLALLTHYSAGPWVVAIVVALVIAQRRSWKETAWWRGLAAFVIALSLVLALWLGWSVLRFGIRGTATANSTAAGWSQQGWRQHLATPALNAFDTLVPFPLRGEPQDGLINQRSRLGHWRDVGFNVYQVNLPLGLGLAGLWVVGLALAKSRKRSTTAAAASSATRTFFTVLIPAVFLLGTAVVTQRDEWGLAHICLQGLILLGLAWAAAELPELTRTARAIWFGLAVIDFAIGVVLHLGLESWALARWVAPDHSAASFVHALARSATVNATDKWAFGLQYVSDRLQAAPAAAGLWLALLVALAIFRLRSAEPPLR